MRKAIIIPAVLAAGFSASAMAEHEYFDDAPVISVVPQTERVNYPRQQCHTEYIREATSSRSPVGAIIGGIAGGLLGSQVGKGNGRVAGAAVGAGVGAVVGDRIGGSPQTAYTTRPVEQCATVDNWETVNRGYLVTYRYNGRDYTTVTDSDPGDRIRVRVAVSADDVREISYYEPAPARIVYREPIVVGPVYQERYHGDGPGRHGRHYW